ncbi:Sporulation and spore germination [Caloramator quimbayensis]|uniref:Sporulation and spore germination n=1 Tax=Caloramator quimbayensis TaxID=1147123 RepID=A0A1T4YE70_9CLOT|nr:GerMN domain-containing protein [Caloramator quimbayensis]SKB00122.1 Sporulation and spore germination [Caloramator quimbayensis]
MKKIIMAILLLPIFLNFSGCTKKTNEIPKTSTKIEKSAIEDKKSKVNIILFYPSKEGSSLSASSRLVSFNNSLERTILEEFLKGTDTKDTLYIIPKGTKLLSVSRKEDTIILDLSKEFNDISTENEAVLNNTIYSIVNSLTEIPGIKNVIIRVEGKVPKINNISFENPFKRNRSIFNRDKTSKPNDILKKQMEFESQGRWLDAYLLYSDDENNTYRKYFDDYVKENEEAFAQGFISKNFTVGSYTVDNTGTHALVKVKFNDTNRELNIGMIKIEESWMVDWIPPQ